MSTVVVYKLLFTSHALYPPSYYGLGLRFRPSLEWEYPIREYPIVGLSYILPAIMVY